MAVVGGDAATDVFPSRVDGVGLPVHTLPIGPIPVTGGTGSPVNALAVF